MIGRAAFVVLAALAVQPGHALYVTTSNCDGRGTCPRERDVILRVTPAAAAAAKSARR